MDPKPNPRMSAPGDEEAAERPARSPAEIHHDIQRTRAELDSTLNALERKLSPDRVKYEATQSLGRVVEERPVAIAAAAAAGGWLLGRLVRRLGGRGGD